MPHEQEEKGGPRSQGKAIGESLARSAHEPSLRRRQKTQAANDGRKCGLFGIVRTWPWAALSKAIEAADRERPDAPTEKPHLGAKAPTGGKKSGFSVPA